MTGNGARRTSLRWRFAAWLLAALLGLAGPLAVYYQLRIDHLVAREADDRLSALARHLASGALLGVLAHSDDLLQGTIEGALSERDVLAVAAFDASGTLVAARAREGAQAPSWPGESRSCQPCRVDDGRLRWVAPVHRRPAAPGAGTQEDFYRGPPPGGPSSGKPVGWIVMEVSTAQRKADERDAGRSGLLISASVLAVALVLTLFVAQRLTSPIRALAAAAREIARGRWNAPLPNRSYGEIGQLAADFETMTAALAELDKVNRTHNEQLDEKVRSRTRDLREANEQLKAMAEEKDRFVATVSHDFRSPLAVILASIQTIIADEAMPPTVRAVFLARAERQSQRLGALVSDLLDLARIENREAEFRSESLGSITEAAIDLARSQLEARDVSLRYAPTHSPIEAEVDRGQVEQALANLLSNAVKFTPPKGQVSITLEIDHDQAVVRVLDTGPGIPPDELPHIFERFFQGERGRAMGGGSGLGLAIVARVARAHGGEIRAHSPPGRGATFELRLPLVRSRTRREA